jgi:CBS domain-containing protein
MHVASYSVVDVTGVSNRSKGMLVKNRMTQDVYTVESDTSLDEVWDLMQALDVRHMPVLKGKRLAGIISDRDVFLRAVSVNDSVVVPKIPVSEVMTRQVITCHASSQIGQVAATMLERKIDCLPVVSDGELVGLITSSDLMEILCISASGVCHQVIPVNFRIHNYPEYALATSNNPRM